MLLAHEFFYLEFFELNIGGVYLSMGNLALYTANSKFPAKSHFVAFQPLLQILEKLIKAHIDVTIVASLILSLIVSTANCDIASTKARIET